MITLFKCAFHNTLITTSSCSASCSIPKNRASSKTPGKQRMTRHGTGPCAVGNKMTRWWRKIEKAHLVYLFLHWQWADRVSNSSESVQSIQGCGRSGTPHTCPVCFPTHLQRIIPLTYKRLTSELQFLVGISRGTFFTEHVSEHALRLFADQSTPEHKSES